MVNKHESPAFCGWNVEEENQVGQAGLPLKLLRYPHPFKCAVAINNDTDGLHLDAFLGFHDFINGNKPTPLGDGLGLEVGNSFWIWAENGNLSLIHAHPSKEAGLSRDAEIIKEFAQAGWLDTLHGCGAWNGDWTLDRERIAFGLNLLTEQGIKPVIYSNHGGYNMAHNIGGPWGYYQHGDLPGKRSYCLDLLTDFGFRYFWTDVFYELDKFGEHQVFENQMKLDKEVSEHDFHRYFNSNDPEDYTRSRIVFPNIAKHEVDSWKKKLFNRLLVDVPTRDGKIIKVVKRFRGHDGPNAGNFVQQVNAEQLDKLEICGGAVVIYQHFGIWRAIGMGKRHRSQRSVHAPALDEHAIWAFRELAQRQAEGRVFITTTSRLLDYLWVRDNLNFSVEGSDLSRLILIHSIDCPTFGKVTLKPNQLQGIGFHVPSKWLEIKVIIEGSPIPLNFQRTPSSSSTSTSEDIIFIPWQRLEYPR